MYENIYNAPLLQPKQSRVQKVNGSQAVSDHDPRDPSRFIDTWPTDPLPAVVGVWGEAPAKLYSM